MQLDLCPNSSWRARPALQREQVYLRRDLLAPIAALVLAAYLCSATACLAQGNEPVEVQFIEMTKGDLSKRLAFYIRDEFKGSPSFSLVEWAEYEVTLKAVDHGDDTDDPGHVSYTVIWSIFDVNDSKPFSYYVDSFVGYAGSQRLKDAASYILVSTDEVFRDAADLQERWQDNHHD